MPPLVSWALLVGDATDPSSLLMALRGDDREGRATEGGELLNASAPCPAAPCAARVRSDKLRNTSGGIAVFREPPTLLPSPPPSPAVKDRRTASVPL